MRARASRWKACRVGSSVAVQAPGWAARELEALGPISQAEQLWVVLKRLGRDVRAAIFHRVTDFSAREVGRFGAPSLITRVTNDVAQVQMLVQMTCTLLIAAPITAVFGVVMASQEDVALTWIPVIAIPILLLVVGNVIARMVPTYRVLQDRTDGINRVLREQIAGVRVVGLP